MQLKSLIEQASAKAGNDNRLAKELGYPNSVIAGWKSGARTCTEADRVQLAEIAGVAIEEVIADAMLERWEGTPKGDRLRLAFTRRGWLKSVTNS